jgi:hypothetical protein
MIEDGNIIKKRAWNMLEYDFRRIPKRVAATIKTAIGRMVWYDKSNLYYGRDDGSFDDISSSSFMKIDKKLPDPIYRGRLSFYPITKVAETGAAKMLPQGMEPGYVEFFADMLCGTLGVHYGRDGAELWRRIDRHVERIQSIENQYGVKSKIDGVYEIVMDMIAWHPEFAPLKIMNGIAIGNKFYGGLFEEPLTDEMIPRHIVDEHKTDMKKAKDFFNMVCPNNTDRHNLMLATVYPFYKRNFEKYFILKGSGGNGKSFYMRHLRKLMGDKFAVIDLDAMIAGGFEKSSAIAKLSNKLVVQAPETNLENPKFLNQLKKIATGESLVAREIGGNSFEFRCEAVLFIDTNDPVILGDTPAIRRRTVNIDFTMRHLSWSDMEPYADWLSTYEGALSIFKFAYNHYIEESSAKFNFYSVERDTDKKVEQQIDLGDNAEVIERLMNDYLRYGARETYVLAGEIVAENPVKKGLIYNFYGLETMTKRIDGIATRVVVIADEETFKLRIRECGMEELT